jgi:two-component system KDP operon response regulator KdpE
VIADVQRPILLVEDDAEQRSAMRDLLVEEGHVVVEASNGRLALDYLLDSEAQPRLILLDLNMPVMPGWELIRVAESYLRLAKIPIVVVTGEPGRIEVSSPNVVGRLSKPFPVDDLLALVTKYAGSGARSTE